MSEKSLVRLGLLRALMGTLIEEWGNEVVRSCLDELNVPTSHKSGQAPTRVGKRSNSPRGSRTSEKPTASAMAEKVSLPPVQKQLIQKLAAQYDSKEFLPTSGDIRYFFEVHGETATPSKQRSDAFRRVLKLLSTLTESSLRKMIDDDAHSGPSRLAPLSEAMRGVGEHRSIERGLVLAQRDKICNDADSDREDRATSAPFTSDNGAEK
ncbi:MAG: hypothetical protein KBA96_05580 [Rhodocyclaceae bacterium]|nr:hypothetical protein [Rhodocyclaceae bacterium]MBP7080561.1 hypothetical protein [Rhodocyclaceae bacterium]